MTHLNNMVILLHVPREKIMETRDGSQWKLAPVCTAGSCLQLPQPSIRKRSCVVAIVALLPGRVSTCVHNPEASRWISTNENAQFCLKEHSFTNT